ncbi:HEXXH motif domain-containing protein [Sphaerisporangium aureirubrum]|uniref:HEXXH motif domain-containing protein n=1 Tax=Sphaerisporangium aureirubrum TaxID=1544736 RepID=A0ABW1NRA9_9ACTN
MVADDVPRRWHGIPAGHFEDLARGGGGAAVGELVAAQHSKHALLVRAVVDEAVAHGHPGGGAAEDAYAALTEVQRRAPEAVAAVVRYPATGAWALRTAQRLRAGDGAAVPGRLAGLAAAAAVRGAVALSVRVPREPDGTVHLPSVGVACLPDGDGAGVEVEVSGDGSALIGGRVRVRPAGGGPVRAVAEVVGGSADQGWTGVRMVGLGGGFSPVFDDVEPFRFPSGEVRGRLAEGELGEWAGTLRAGWEVLCRVHPETASEVVTAVRVLTPLAAPGPGTLSGTARETFGCVALSRPPDAVAAAAMLAHEIQHAKLTALMDLFPFVTSPSSDRRFYAPWRDDARPVTGLLHGAYAHLGVAGFWRRQRHEEADPAEVTAAHTKFARWRDGAAEVTAQLAASGLLTPAGLRFVLGMAEVLEGWRADPVPAEAASVARRAAETHRAAWIRRHGRPVVPG